MEITGVAPENVSDAYISLYSEGSMAVHDCSLSLTTDLVHIPDWVLNNLVRDELGITDNLLLNTTELSNLTEIRYSSEEINPSLGGTCCTPDISSLQGLEFAKNLQALSLKGSKITDFSSLYGLSDLEELGLGNQGLTNIDFLSNMSQIQKLSFVSNGISYPRNNIADISVLSNLANLVSVNFKDYNGSGNALDTSNQAAHEQVIQGLRNRGVTVTY